MSFYCPICAKKGQTSRLISYKLDLKGTKADFCESTKCSYPIEMGSFFDFLKLSDSQKSSSKRIDPKKPRRSKFLMKELEKSQEMIKTMNDSVSPTHSNDSGIILPTLLTNPSSSSSNSVINSHSLNLQSPARSENSENEMRTKYVNFAEKIHCFWSQMDGKAWIDALVDITVHNSLLVKIIMDDPLNKSRISGDMERSFDSLETFFAFCRQIVLKNEAQGFVRKLLCSYCSSLLLFEAFGNQPEGVLDSLRRFLDEIIPRNEFQSSIKRILESKAILCASFGLSFDGHVNLINLLKRLTIQSSNLAQNCRFVVSHTAVCETCAKVDHQRIVKCLLEFDGLVSMDMEKCVFETTSLCECGGDLRNEYNLDELSNVFFISAKCGFGEFNYNKTIKHGDLVYVMTAVVGINLKSGFPLCWFRDLAENSWMPSTWPEVSLSAHVFKNPDLPNS